MTDDAAHPVNLNLPEKLRDRKFRQRYFLAEASARIAEQLIELRERRGLSQTQLADQIGTRQPGISRVEKANYQNWSFNTLRKIANALDARIRVSIQPSEDVLGEYEEDDQHVTDDDSANTEESVVPSPDQFVYTESLGAFDPVISVSSNTIAPALNNLGQLTGIGSGIYSYELPTTGAVPIKTGALGILAQLFQPNEALNLRRALAASAGEIARLRAELADEKEKTAKLRAALLNPQTFLQPPTQQHSDTPASKFYVEQSEIRAA